jgi:hypothetical protein
MILLDPNAISEPWKAARAGVLSFEAGGVRGLEFMGECLMSETDPAARV